MIAEMDIVVSLNMPNNKMFRRIVCMDTENVRCGTGNIGRMEGTRRRVQREHSVRGIARRIKSSARMDGTLWQLDSTPVSPIWISQSFAHPGTNLSS